MLKYIVVVGAICIPVQFWLLTRAIFDYHFKFVPGMIGLFLVQIIPHFHFFIHGLISVSLFESLSNIVAGGVSLGFVLAGLYTAVKTKQGDLIDSRIRFRNIFIVVTASLIGITLIVEAIPIQRRTIVILQILQRTSILGTTLYFLVS